MFKVVPKDQRRVFRKKVEFQHPNEQGEFDKSSMMVTYQMLSSEESTEVANSTTAAQFGRKVVVGYSEVMAADGTEMPYSEAGRDALLADPIVAIAVRETYWEAINGGQLKRKN